MWRIIVIFVGMYEYHKPVLLKESVDALVSSPDGVYADATFGGGGHSREILSRLSDRGKLIAFDRDADAVERGFDDPRFSLVHNNFRFIHNYTLLYSHQLHQTPQTAANLQDNFSAKHQSINSSHHPSAGADRQSAESDSQAVTDTANFQDCFSANFQDCYNDKLQEINGADWLNGHDGQNVEVVGHQALTKVQETSVREPETDTDRQKIGSIATEPSTGEQGCQDKEAIEFVGLDGILADLGVSSHQFDTAERGFSFRYDAPLDMRMNTKAELTAADVVNGYEAEELERIFRLYGEVENARKLSQLIVKNRAISRIETTSQLDKAIEEATPKFAEHKYLAKVYQALRIEVNQEMRSLEKFLEGCAKSLKSGGKLVVITYHSLEDRMVKNFIKSGRIDGVLEKDVFGQSKEPFEAVNRKPILPSEEEISENTRARSAKLRIAVKK